MGTWSTDDEEANRGFLVERKAVGYSDWDEVASYQSWSPLKSKGTLGGAYSYIDATVSEGEWLYRIVAEQSDNSRAIVSRSASPSRTRASSSRRSCSSAA